MLQRIIKRHYSVLFIIAWLIPCVISLYKIISGNVPFWYDETRDLLSAWDNLSKPTLIGPPAGIPGIFYGPYWIWILSMGLIFSKNPRFIIMWAGLIPFFVIFPLILLKFKKTISKYAVLIIWILFIFSIGKDYAINLWNPHLASLFLLVLIYLITFWNIYTIKSIKNIIIVGFISGLILHFHISLGIGTLLGVLFYSLINLYKDNKPFKSIANIFIKYGSFFFSFFIGFGISFLPYALFELRHGFNQSKTYMYTFLKYGDVVGNLGLSNEQIILTLSSKFGSLLHVADALSSPIFFIFIIITLFGIIQRKAFFKRAEYSLLSLLLSLLLSIMFIYLTARNPVWDYHFVGIEVILLLIIGLFISKINVLKTIFILLSIYIVIVSFFVFINELPSDPLRSTSLITNEYMVDIIHKDAKGMPYAVFAYSQSIYTYEYTYLFRWKHNKDVPYDPGSIPQGNPLVYLIIPKEIEKEKENFINYRTPNDTYITTKEWFIPNDTIILKREKNKNSS